LCGCCALLELFLELVDSKGVRRLAKVLHSRTHRDIQLLEIAICNIMAAPIRDGIELNAVGELHLVVLLKPRELLSPLLRPPRLSRISRLL
jgi:hypothetical protein